MVNLGSKLLMAGAILVIPVVANATTFTFSSDLFVNQIVSRAEVLSPGDEIEYRFNVMDDLEIYQFSVSATGNNATADIEEIRFGFFSPGTNPYTTILSMGTSAFGGGFLEGLVLSAGDTFSIFFTDGVTNPVSVGLSFETVPPSPIPIPASFSLLGGALLLGGIFAARRRKAFVGDLTT